MCTQVAHTEHVTAVGTVVAVVGVAGGVVHSGAVCALCAAVLLCT